MMRKLALSAAGERRAGLEHPPHRRQRLGQRRAQRQHPLGRRQLAADADEQRVAERLAEPPQRVADRALRQPELARGPDRAGVRSRTSSTRRWAQIDPRRMNHVHAAGMTTMSFMMPCSGRTVAGMTTTKLLAPALLTAAFALACAHGGDGGDDPDNPEAAPRIAGRYVSDCSPSPQADGSTQYLRARLRHRRRRVGARLRHPRRRRLRHQAGHRPHRGPYELERPSTAVEARGRPASASPPRRSARGRRPARLPQFARRLRRRRLRHRRRPGRAQGPGCAGFGQYPGADCPADYDVVKRDGDDLFFGARPADNDMCTAAKRPAALSPARQPPPLIAGRATATTRHHGWRRSAARAGTGPRARVLALRLQSSRERPRSCPRAGRHRSHRCGGYSRSSLRACPAPRVRGEGSARGAARAASPRRTSTQC